MRDKARIAVVVPAKNEELHLGVVLSSMPEWVDEVIVVDDGSSDRTRDIADASERCTCLLANVRSRGVGAAIAWGYDVALERGADVVAVMAGDDQMRPDELARVVGPVVRGEVDYAKGNRLAHPRAKETMPSARRMGTRILGHMTGWVSGISTRDAQCGYTAISGDMLRKLPLETLYPRYGYPNDLLVMLGLAGARVEEPMVSPVYEGQASGLKVRRALFTHAWVLARAIWLKRRRRRLIDRRGRSLDGEKGQDGRETDELSRLRDVG